MVRPALIQFNYAFSIEFQCVKMSSGKDEHILLKCHMHECSLDDEFMNFRNMAIHVLISQSIFMQTYSFYKKSVKLF